MLIISAVNKKGGHAPGNVFTAGAGSHSPPPRHCGGGGRPRALPGRPRGDPKSQAGGGRRRNWGARHRKAAFRGKQCVPSRKQRQHTQTQMPAESGSRRARRRACGFAGAGGASPVWPGGSVADCGGPGGHSCPAEGAPKEPRLCRGGGREEEGDLFKLGGWASRGDKKRRKRRNRLMLRRTPRVFLSGGITSTFRQEQELGGRQQHGLTARR